MQKYPRPQKAKKDDQCCWCIHRTVMETGRVYIFKIKMTSGRIAKKKFHKKCLKQMLTAKPTKKNAKLVRKK